jgi:flagellar motility protein MotE (MotC chaperone)
MLCLIGALLYLGTSAAVWKQPVLPKPTAATDPVTRIKGPAWDFTNPELDQLVAELKKEREDLAQRRLDLDQLAARLQVERQEINQVTQTVWQLQKELDQTIVRVGEEESSNLKKLAKTYATMEPEGAATILNATDEITAVKILAFMKENEVGPILQSLARGSEAQAKRVAGLSERLRLTLHRPNPPKTQ